ncbi:hypothetical protein PAP_00095 [Palaeococcus pacificus DY20341]|uniref:Rubrerythrin diiron-binding domain-containing protein n=1 Tax=Palaeococcus pacificus DY20341 TaxID=1343739 RepID=A0A075LR61_9EURY|nr:ferritin family protein [Palaeococcus pacificus]AIF68467.1 hypothetical protein PAP_00095 [Palaeococcus pacificus DY20341]
MIDKGLVEDLINILRNLEPWEIISYSISAETDSNRMYLDLAERIENSTLRERFKYLAEQEAKHKETLERLFKMLYPEKEPLKFNAYPLEAFSVYEDLKKAKDEVHVLELAMLSETVASQVYDYLASVVGDEGAKQAFKQLSLMERGHYELLYKEYENL